MLLPSAYTHAAPGASSYDICCSAPTKRTLEFLLNGEEDHGMSIGAIVGVVVASLVGAAALGGAVWFLWRYHRAGGGLIRDAKNTPSGLSGREMQQRQQQPEPSSPQEQAAAGSSPPEGSRSPIQVPSREAPFELPGQTGYRPRGNVYEMA